MSIFDIFRRKRKELDEDELRWDKMWELWENEEAASPYAEIMTYEAEINNGGHSQYFYNLANSGNLAEAEELLSLLPEPLLQPQLQVLPQRRPVPRRTCRRCQL
jgi:hypothetical protein